MIIGIDPDASASGCALVHDGRIVSMHALGFYDLVQFIAQYDGVQVVIEDVEHEKTTHHRPGTNARAHAKISRNVGKVQGIACALVDYLKGAGVNVMQIPPLRGPLKKQCKADAEYFNRVTGWQGRSNADKRDAALIAITGEKICKANVRRTACLNR